MNRAASIIVGLLILIGIWAGLFVLASSNIDETTQIIFIYSIVLLQGLAYSLLHQKDYPIQVVLVVLVVEYILKRLEGQGVSRVLFDVLVFEVNLILGTIFAIFGPLVAKAFTFTLSPLQRFFNSIGLRMSIPVIAGILAFIISYTLLVTEVIYI